MVNLMIYTVKNRQLPMFRRSSAVKPIQTVEANPFLLFKDPIKVSMYHVRDAIIAKIKELAPMAPLTKPFTDHLLKMGKDKLNKYNTLTFVLQEFHLTIQIFTPLVGGETLTYTLPVDAGDPPADLLRTKFLGLF